MKNVLLLLSISLFLFASCNKKENTVTKVGFYFENKNVADDISYDLYIDDQYEGKIGVYREEPSDTSLLLFRMLDDKKHDIDVKLNGVYLSTTYLQISKRKTCSGTNTRKSQRVHGMNGAKYREGTQKGFSVYAPFQ